MGKKDKHFTSLLYSKSDSILSSSLLSAALFSVLWKLDTVFNNEFFIEFGTIQFLMRSILLTPFPKGGGKGFCRGGFTGERVNDVFILPGRVRNGNALMYIPKGPKRPLYGVFRIIVPPDSLDGTQSSLLRFLEVNLTVLTQLKSRKFRKIGKIIYFDAHHFCHSKHMKPFKRSWFLKLENKLSCFYD